MFLLNTILACAQSPCSREHDSLELVRVYNGNNGDDWYWPWPLDRSIHGWLGVRLNDSSCVAWLELTDAGLVGDFLSLDLANLVVLEFGFNNLSGEIKLENINNGLGILRLGHNQLSGALPELDKFTDIQLIDLKHNNLSGNLAELPTLTNLRVLDLSNNRFTGQVETFADFPTLLYLHLDSNHISGPLPMLLVDSLTRADLHSNNFSGCIPNNYCNTTTRINIYDNPGLPFNGDLTKICEVAEKYSSTEISCNRVGDLVIEYSWPSLVGIDYYEIVTSTGVFHTTQNAIQLESGCNGENVMRALRIYSDILCDPIEIIYDCDIDIHLGNMTSRNRKRLVARNLQELQNMATFSSRCDHRVTMTTVQGARIFQGTTEQLFSSNVYIPSGLYFVHLLTESEDLYIEIAITH